MNIFKITNFLAKGNKSLFDIPVHEQYAYMNALGEPKNDIDRSYKQFLCQDFFVPTWKKNIWRIAGSISIPFVIITLWIKGLRIRFVNVVDTVAEKKGMDEVIPRELSGKYRINHDVWNAGMGLNTQDVRYILTKICPRKEPYFLLKMAILIAKRSAIITKYRPKRIIEHSEFSFGSSAITDYCHCRGVRHINVQHGEKLRFIRDSFFHYDECYVWDEHYVNMFIEQHAEPNQFHVVVPPSLHINTEAHKNPAVYADYKYFLALNSEEELKSIVASMSFAKREGKIVKYRIHPRYTNLDVLRKFVDDEDIEYPSRVSILDSVSNLEYAVGSFTTVLLQAHLSGKKVVLDDVTYRERYEQLANYGYILANKKLKRLSDFQI